MESSKDQLLKNPRFKDAEVWSKSRESEHPDAMMILIPGRNIAEAEVWRVEASPTLDYEVEFKLIFILLVQGPV